MSDMSGRLKPGTLIVIDRDDTFRLANFRRGDPGLVMGHDYLGLTLVMWPNGYVEGLRLEGPGSFWALNRHVAVG